MTQGNGSPGDARSAGEMAGGGRRRTGAGDVAASLRRRIASGQFVHNERLPPERAVAEQFGVSRGTVRDALSQLEDAGFVERRAGSGTYVIYSEANLSESILRTTSPLQLVDARFALEPQIVRLAVINANLDGLQRTERALARMEDCGHDPQIFSAGDEAFHLDLAQCTQNPLLEWMTRRVNEVRSNSQWNRVRTQVLTPAAIDAYNRQHRAIFEAICQRDAEAAARIMREHLRAARDALVNAASS